MLTPAVEVLVGVAAGEGAGVAVLPVPGTIPGAVEPAAVGDGAEADPGPVNAVDVGVAVPIAGADIGDGGLPAPAVGTRTEAEEVGAGVDWLLYRDSLAIVDSLSLFVLSTDGRENDLSDCTKPTVYRKHNQHIVKKNH